MNDPRTGGGKTADLQAAFEWLSSPPATVPEDELPLLLTHATAIRAAALEPRQRIEIAGLLHDRALIAARRLLPGLREASLPLSRRTGQIVREMQGILLVQAEEALAWTMPQTPERDPSADGLGLWRAAASLSLHLQISSHVAAPYGTGIWQLLNEALAAAQALGCAEVHPRGRDGSIRDLYLRACLLACAQPASMTSREIGLAADYIERFASRAEFLPRDKAAEAGGAFWIDPGRDAPPTSFSRRPAPDDALCFACERLAQLAEEQADALEAGAGSTELDLPVEAATPGGRSVLRRLARHWGRPGKRRFPRRRQSFRAELCVGLPSVRQIFADDGRTTETTQWLVTNESPDGYALMHASGRTGTLHPGDMAAVRTEQNAKWQACVVRWVLSENPEHLELGLQILAPRAQPATLLPLTGTAGEGRIEALTLPALPPFRPHEALIVPPGSGLGPGQKLVLMSERGNLGIREIRTLHVEEQTACILAVAFETDPGD